MSTHAGPPASTIVVIGASAGGISALRTVLAGLPSDFPASIVIVQHRAADTESYLLSILARSSTLPVNEARAGDLAAPGTVYLARADLHLTVTGDARFAYSDGHRIHHLLSSVNPLFISSAAAYGSRAIAVVLSGTGKDGTDGVQAIKAHGGIVIAQDAATADHFGMPGSAIESGAVDYVLPVDQIAPALVRLVGPATPAAVTPLANGDV